MTFRASLLMTAAAVATSALCVTFGPTLAGQEARGKAALLVNIENIKDQAPATFKVNVDTSKGAVVLDIHRDWAPLGVDRFYALTKRGFYDGNRFFRVTDILAQWGINGDPEVAQHWLQSVFPDDPTRKQSNKRGTIAFLQANGRRTQVFVNLVDNQVLDSQISPIGQVTSGMDVFGKLYQVETAPTGKGPTLTQMFRGGNAVLEKEFPQLDYIKTATITE